MSEPSVAAMDVVKAAHEMALEALAPGAVARALDSAARIRPLGPTDRKLLEAAVMAALEGGEWFLTTIVTSLLVDCLKGPLESRTAQARALLARVARQVETLRAEASSRPQ